jgi:hypothetical protein
MATGDVLPCVGMGIKDGPGIDLSSSSHLLEVSKNRESRQKFPATGGDIPGEVYSKAPESR